MDNSGQRGQRTITINAHPFDWHDKIGYMFGDIGNNFSFNVVNCAGPIICTYGQRLANGSQDGLGLGHLYCLGGSVFYS